MAKTICVFMGIITMITLLGCFGQTGEGNSLLQAGDKTVSFNVYDVTGPNKGKNLCYV